MLLSDTGAFCISRSKPSSPETPKSSDDKSPADKASGEMASGSIAMHVVLVLLLLLLILLAIIGLFAILYFIGYRCLVAAKGPRPSRFSAYKSERSSTCRRTSTGGRTR